jgi:hypothetical protein
MPSNHISPENEFGRRTLSLFMDEAGHGDFQSGQRFFAIGGIAGLGPQVEHATKLWRELKARHFGDADAPLPASGKMMTPPQIEAISGYFARSKLPRFVFIIKRPPIFPPSINVLRMLHPIMVEELTRMIGELPTLPSNVLVCLEHTELLSPKIIEAMPAIALEIHDTQVPLVGVFIHKGSSEPLLEMADQLTWRAQQQCKHGDPGMEPMPEFLAAFPEGAPYAIRRELRLAKAIGAEGWGLTFSDDPARPQAEWRGRKTAAGI